MKRNSIRRCSIVAVLISLFMSLTLMACSSQEAVNEETTAEEEKDVVIVDDTVQQEETSVKTEEVIVQEEISNEESEEVSQKEPIYLTPKEWMEALELDETVIFVWNAETLENTIIEEQMEYEIKENDRFFVYNSTGIGKFDFSPQTVFWGKETSEADTEPIEVFLNVTKTESITVTEQIDGETFEHHFTLMVSSTEDVESSTEEMQAIDINTDSDEPSDTWIESLGMEIQEPFIVILNDTDGTKVLVEETEVYQVHNDDKLFLYVPQGAMCMSTGDTEGILTNTESKDNGKVWQISTDYIDTEFTLVFTVDGIMEDKDVSVSCTLTK